MDFEKLFHDTSFVLLYLAIALVGGIIITGALVYFFKKDKLSVFKKYVIGIATGFAICAFTLMTYLKAEGNKLDGTPMNNMLFIPIMVEIAIVIAGMVAILICSLFTKKAVRIASITTGVLLIGGFIAIMVEMSKYFEIEGTPYDANTVGLIVTAIVFMALIAVIYFLGDKRNISDTRSIVYGAVAIALSFALSYIKFFEMPQGGSLTFASLLPLMIYCCMFGTRRGVIACLIYGVLQAIQDPWIIHPMQFLLDYPLAFGMIGVSGIFVEKGVFKFKGKMQRFNKVFGFALGAIIAVIGRYICHVCTGVFAFHTWADLATYSSVTVYSMAYNSFAFADMAISLTAGIMLFMSNAFVTQMAKSGDIGKAVTEPAPQIPDEEEEDDGFVYLDDLKKQEESAVGLQEPTSSDDNQPTSSDNSDNE